MSLTCVRQCVNGLTNTYGSRLIPEEERLVGKRVREHLEIGATKLRHLLRTMYPHSLSLHFPRTLQPIQLPSHYKWSPCFVLRSRFPVSIIYLSYHIHRHLWLYKRSNLHSKRILWMILGIAWSNTVITCKQRNLVEVKFKTNVVIFFRIYRFS